MNDQTLNNAYIIAAKLVSKFGDDHLPVFERLHFEVTERAKKSDLKQLALKINQNEFCNNLKVKKLR